MPLLWLSGSTPSSPMPCSPVSWHVFQPSFDLRSLGASPTLPWWTPRYALKISYRGVAVLISKLWPMALSYFKNMFVFSPTTVQRLDFAQYLLAAQPDGKKSIKTFQHAKKGKSLIFSSNPNQSAPAKLNNRTPFHLSPLLTSSTPNDVSALARFCRLCSTAKASGVISDTSGGGLGRFMVARAQVGGSLGIWKLLKGPVFWTCAKVWLQMFGDCEPVSLSHSNWWTTWQTSLRICLRHPDEKVSHVV